MDPLRLLKNDICKMDYVDRRNDKILCPICNYSIKIISVNYHIKRCETHEILLTKYYKNNVH